MARASSPAKQLGPVPDALVGGDRMRAAAVAVAHQAEEQAGLLAAHRLEAHLVDDQQGRVMYFLRRSRAGARSASACSAASSSSRR